jgi:type III pantothenate kinase
VTVADMTKNLAIHNLLSNLALQPHWLRPAASGGGVRNLYKPPGSLGADRWAALVGARQRTLDACLVVSAGTALTIDALRADGSFPGGAIIPGMQAMRRSLALATAHVGERYGQPNAFPDNTADAVESGLLLAMSGAIQQMHGRLAALESAAPVCLLHGGDADALIEILPFATQHAPNLILEGVCALARGTH